MHGRPVKFDASDRPKPIQKAQIEGSGEDHESAKIYLCNQHSGEEKRSKYAAIQYYLTA